MSNVLSRFTGPGVTLTESTRKFHHSPVGEKEGLEMGGTGWSKVVSQSGP